MECHKWAVGIFVLMSISMVAEAHAVTISDVYVDGQAVGGAPVSGANCIDFTIGTADGTDYTNTTIQGADGMNPARILAIENNYSCYGLASSARDRLILVNTRIIPRTANTNLTLEYRGLFGPSPNGSVVFGGSMRGKFFLNNVAVSCTGSTPPNGPCKVIYDTGIFSLVDGTEHGLPEITTLNPFGGSFNVVIPNSTAINVGTQNRTHHAQITTILPTLNHRLEIKGTDSFVSQGPPRKKKPHVPAGVTAPTVPKNQP